MSNFYDEEEVDKKKKKYQNSKYTKILKQYIEKTTYEALHPKEAAEKRRKKGSTLMDDEVY